MNSPASNRWKKRSSEIPVIGIRAGKRRTRSLVSAVANHMSPREMILEKESQKMSDSDAQQFLRAHFDCRRALIDHGAKTTSRCNL
jgi:hypothetical protein